MQAEWMLGLCERFGKLPSEIEAESSEFIRMIRLEALGKEGESRGR
jgi:hypothetical protein